MDKGLENQTEIVYIKYMSRLVIVSNRLPVSITKCASQLSFQPSVGGLATGLASFRDSHQSQWIGWPGIAKDKISTQQKKRIIDKLKEAHGKEYNPSICTLNEVGQQYYDFIERVICEKN